MDPNNQQRPLPTDLPAPGSGDPLPPPPPPPVAAPAAAPPPLPATPAAPPSLEVPTAGEKRMAKGPAVNAGWEICDIMANPNDPTIALVRFPDGTVYTADSVQIGGRVAATVPPAPEPTAAAPAATPLLTPDFNSFKSIIVSMHRQSLRLFDLPLDVLLTMITRYANNQGLPANGRVGVYGGLATFVPDEQTLNEWAEAYMLEVQRRLQQAGTGPEM